MNEIQYSIQTKPIRYLIVLLSTLGASYSTYGANLNVTITSAGSATVNGQPGATLPYQVMAQLSNTSNDGLAGFTFDLDFSGGSLTPVGRPATGPTANFDRPMGMTNPGGYGGTISGGRLLQVGGIQNTFKNTATGAAAPTGSVVENVGHTATLLANGTVVVPNTPGIYSLTAINLIANALRQGETGAGTYWAVEPIGLGVVSPLTIVVGVPCMTTIDCVLADSAPNGACTCNNCSTGVCSSTLIEFGNVNCAGPVTTNLDDILCVLGGFTSFAACPNGDIAPCAGNNMINLDDILGVLAAFAGGDPCGCTP